MPVSSLLTLLLAEAEPRLRDFSSVLIPSLSRPMLGVRLPKLREIARSEARRGTGEAFDEVREEDCFEQVMVKGMTIGYADLPVDVRMERIRQFVPHIDNWALCDSCAATYTTVRAHRADFLPLLKHYAADANQYMQRFAAVMLLDHYLTAGYVEPVLTLLASIRPAGDDAVKGVGWALATLAAKYPDYTLSILGDERIPLPCRKMARRKMLESRRTPRELRPSVKSYLL